MTQCNHHHRRHEHMIAYLAADLRRYSQLVAPQKPASWRMWLLLPTPRFAPVLLCRLAHQLYRWRLGPLAKIVSLINFLFFGIEIAVRCPIGPGLVLPHTQGTVIGAQAVGANATIFQGVTIGAKEMDFEFHADRRPLVGDDVIVGSGAKVLGGIMIGNGARIGANTVVIESLPAHSLAVGAATRVIGSQAA